LADGKSVKLCAIYPTKKILLALKLKIFQGKRYRMCSENSRFHPNRFTFGGIISERLNTVRARSKVNPIFGYKCGPMPNVMAALPYIGGALCLTPQSLAHAQ